MINFIEMWLPEIAVVFLYVFIAIKLFIRVKRKA